jgi:hypothetical protein
MFINTELFREAATYYEKNGRYDDGVYGGYECIEYWKREEERVLNGYSVGGVKITGEHYLYLNYLPIQINTVKEKDTDLVKEQLFKGKIKGDRGEGFASFWDADYALFWTWEIAKEGVEGNTLEEKLKNLAVIEQHITLPIVKTFDNLSGGKNHLWLKPRGMGASWKGAAKGARNQFFINDSETYFVAGEKKFLEDQGLYSKYLYHKNSLLGNNKNGQPRCAGFRRSFSKQDISNMNFRAAKVKSVIRDGQKETVEVGGKRSSVIGISINGEPDNIRGKRGNIIYEEFGTFAKVARTWTVAQQSVEQEGIVFGNQFGFGTGGDEKNINIKDLDVMFNNPKSYNLLEFENIFDEELYGMKSAYFTPATYSVSYIDSNGNTDTELSLNSYIEPNRKLLETSPDPQVYTQFCAEKPLKPSEALMATKGNIFPVKELKAHKTRIMASGLHNDVVVKGRLVNLDGTLTFTKSEITDKLFDLYPVPRGTNSNAPIAVIHPPYKSGGRVPPHMYIICVDPYRHDSSEGDSIGSCYVIENPNKLTAYKGDKVVAWYNARPNEQEDFNETIYNLALYYNAKIGFENDEPGDIVGYGKRKKLLHHLEEEFELAYDERIKTKSTSKKSYGMHIASGEDNLRKLQGDMYIKQWLNTVRYTTEDGRVIKNLHLIYDIGLLEELIKYNPKDNFDRIAAFRIGMFYTRELIYKGRTVTVNRKARDPFFKLGLKVA